MLIGGIVERMAELYGAIAASHLKIVRKIA
jgi:hypothetical protein